MSEKRFVVQEDANSNHILLLIDYQKKKMWSFLAEEKEAVEKIGDLLNEQQATIEQLKGILESVENEKEHFADLYNECRRYKLSDEAIKQAYADLNRREREKHSQGNATYTAKMNPNEVIY